MILTKETLKIGDVVARLVLYYSESRGYSVSMSYAGRVTARFSKFDPAFNEDKEKVLMAMVGHEDVETEKYWNDLFGYSSTTKVVSIDSKDEYMNPEVWSEEAKAQAFEYFHQSRYRSPWE